MDKKLLDIPIIVVAYNRTEPLKRILKSLQKASYDSDVELIISLDNSNNNPEVYGIANDFEWANGKKTIIAHKDHLGLRNHILSCGDLSQNHDAVIVLEDDLYVSPYFYDYTYQAVEQYASEPKIAGISLYSHNSNQTRYLPFEPFPEASDVFFMKLPSSWGQCWTKEQWRDFKQWYEVNKNSQITAEKWMLPEDIFEWPETSWKKYFCFYVLDAEKYFVYPRLSLTTNFSDPGTHFISKKSTLQVPLQFTQKRYNFPKLEESLSAYDAYCEILPSKLQKLCPQLKDFDFEVDLYGIKPLGRIKKKWLLSTKKCTSPHMSFGREMKPHEMNIVQEMDGDDISLGEISSFNEGPPPQEYSLKEILYFYFMVDWIHLKQIYEHLAKRNCPNTTKTKVKIKKKIASILDKLF